MRFSGLCAAGLIAPIVAAHGDFPVPKIVGMGPRDVGKLKARNILGGHARVAAPEHRLAARQGGNNGRCGADQGGASCDAGFCCSIAGYCGQGSDYCEAPDCQFQYGPGCDANRIPAGGSTREIPRPRLGNQPYGGEGIYDCTEPNTIAITYDDGPYIYTSGVLDQFAAYNAKATFFVTGINIGKGAIDDAGQPWPAVIQRMIAEGHQVASHTWSHQDLSAITREQRYDQMVKLEMALANILGRFPTYMRPPYSSCTAASGCQQDLADLGYVVSYFDLDTDDYNNITPELVQNAKDRVFNAINPSNAQVDAFQVIAHDIHQQTAQNLTGYMLDTMTAKGYRLVTLGECLGEPEANWYRDASSGRVATSASFSTPTATPTGAGSGTSSGPVSTPTATSPDATCGAASGFTCLGFAQGECCSQYNFCGNTAGHCGTGCQPGFGNCGSANVPSSGAPSSASSSSSSSPAASSAAASSSSPAASSAAPAPTTATSSSVRPTSLSTSTRPVTTSTRLDTTSTRPATTSTRPATTSTRPVTTSTRPATTSTSTSTRAGTTSTRTSSAPAATSSAAALKVSTDRQCGARSNSTCKGSRFGNCCSRSGTCGSSLLYCMKMLGCQPGFGDCPK